MEYIERLEINKDGYSSIEGAIHINRYLSAKNLCKGLKVLDIACGEGYGSHLLTKWGAKEVVGVDVSESAISEARKNFKEKNISFLVSDAKDLKGIEDETFDMVVSFETIEHIDPPEEFLKEIVRVSKSGAIYVISCPNDYFYYPNKNQGNPFHKKKFHFKEFTELTEKVLGNKVEYLIGTYVNGYMNLNLKDKFVGFKGTDQMDMLKYKTLSTLIVPPDTNLSTEECCYYIGVWNAKAKNASTSYPYSHNELMERIPKIEQLHKDEISDLLTSFEQEREEAQNKISDLLTSFEQEREEAQNKISDLLTSFEQERKELQKELIIESSENSLMKKNIKEFATNYGDLEQELSSILNSRTYKLANKMSGVARKILGKEK